VTGAWYQLCASCGARTCPAERDRLRCNACGEDPRPLRERAASAVLLGALWIAVPLAYPALAVFVVGFAISEALRGEEVRP